MQHVTRADRRLLGTALVALCPMWALTGCAWRSMTADHYFGPVLFRSSAPPSGRAYVNQVMRIGVSGEAGTNWGVTFGVSERTMVAPEDFSAGNPHQNAKTFRPETPSVRHGADAEHTEQWHFSPFYLRVERPQNAFFIARTTYGAELGAGDEACALTAGFARRTLFTPPDNSISQIHFEAAHPLQASARIWRDIKSTDLLPTHLGEELMP